ncbi:hypothetical protein MmiHf6_16390 [Methanimicrococcus hongohii]|uniref:Toprim domain-containing protein n=1 Tax=Methanimicrococcus hongohii TaxID=3028295 RepID=A0AA97A2Q9_9EURY|nr:toprim domain-containing protein [Methanimicrococcus sp. Hf6]WNY24308.1 hypothetical protein MmiHf6_16390 [Methanimicrococcus sp. Hf6]
MKHHAADDRNKIALEEIESVLKDLNGDGNDPKPLNSFLIIVEGRRDVVSLRNLGINAEIVPCANRPAAEFCEEIAEKRKTAIILTDWDRKGGILAARLEDQFKNLEVRVETSQREKLLFYSKREIKDVESLYAHVVKLRESVLKKFEKEEESDSFLFESDLK